MSSARSRSLSLGASRSSSRLFSNGGYETFKSKGFDLVQAMLTEIEDIIREYDSEIAAVCFKSQPSQNSSEANVGEEFRESASLGSQSRARSARSWGYHGSQIWTQYSLDSQSASGEAQTDRDNLNTLTRNIYMLLSTELAPKLQALMKEVGQLRRHNELLSEKVEQQRERNEKQIEELEELQCELRAKEIQLREQKKATKTLDIYQGENAMLKMELKTLRIRMEKLAERNATHTEARTSQENVEVQCRRTPSNENNEWLLKENAELQREVIRWKTESTEKDVVINELKGVIKNMTVSESPRGSVQRRISAAHCRPDSLATPPPTRPAADLVPLVNQVGGALALETPRGRFRNMVLENTGQVSNSQNAPTTLAEDLGVILAKPPDPCNGQPISVPSERRYNRRRGPLVPPAACLTAVRTENSDCRSRFSSVGEMVSEFNLGQRLNDTSVAMESACLEAEDCRALLRRQACELESTIAKLKRLLMQTEERLLAAEAEVGGLRNERCTTLAEQREAQKHLEIATNELRRQSDQIESLQAELQRMQKTLDDLQTEAGNTKHLLTQASEFFEERAPSPEKTGEVPEAVLVSSSREAEPVEGKITLRAESNVSVEGGTLTDTLAIETFQISSAEPSGGPVMNAACTAKPEMGLSTDYHPKLPTESTREQPQLGGPLPRGERIKVVLKSCKPKDCCSPFAFFTMWKSGTPGQSTPRLYSLEPSGDMKAVMWSSRKPRIALQAASDSGK